MLPKLKFCVKIWMGSILLSGLGDQNVGKMGLRDQNNGKKIGINGSRIYHVTTLIFFWKSLLLINGYKVCTKRHLLYI